jgi:acyl-CoA reductase-like NAD-dependent aldehyde dehydrogenase/anthranilate/para-aminobenzoate synthase component II
MIGMKKRLGISFTRTKFQHYWSWCTGEDLQHDIELVELSFEKDNAKDIHGCDGFILTGGIDVDADLYGGEADYENKPDVFQTERDLFESNIYRYAQLHHLPVLGICRGLQLVNVLEGGKLIQDLEVHNEIHRISAVVDKQHEVHIEKDSLLYEVTTVNAGTINSAHHQAIDKNGLGNNLKVNAWSGTVDGTIEGIEFKDKTGKAFMLCVQWHPERMLNKEESPLSINIKKIFLKEIRNTVIKKIQVINPATEELMAEINEDTSQSIADKFELLRTGQPQWAAVPLLQRIACIEKFYILLEKHKDVLAKTLTAEMGKPLQQSYNELNGARDRIKFFIDQSAKWLAEEWTTTEGATKEKITYEPLGVIANISAWNYPYLVGVNVCIPALIAGNAVFYKPSEYTTLTGLHIQDLLYKAGIPVNCFQLVTGSGTVGDMLLNLHLNGFFFTGSYRTGKYIAERVSSHLVPCQLELGGKDPLYVTDDVKDIENVAAAALEGVVYNNGQSCCAVERIYVQEKIFDQFVTSFVAQAKKMRIGDPTNAATEIGPLSRKEQLRFLLAQVADAKEKGAIVLAGGNVLNGKGFFMEPTVLVNVNHAMRIMKEESFGPVIGIQKVKDDDEAIALMQDTEYGLTAAVYSSGFERAEKIMNQMNTGTVYWNCCDRVSAALPWSGRKHSGLGATLSYQGIRAFVQPKAWHIRG